jgi:hypothetical protein
MMKRKCDEEDIKFLKSLMPPEAPCGREYDDLTHSTQCPHDPLPPKLTDEQLEAMLKEHGME